MVTRGNAYYPDLNNKSTTFKHNKHELLQILEQRLNEEHSEEISKLKLEFTQDMDNERNMSNLKMSTEIQKLNQQHSALIGS